MSNKVAPQARPTSPILGLSIASGTVIGAFGALGGLSVVARLGHWKCRRDGCALVSNSAFDASGRKPLDRMGV